MKSLEAVRPTQNLRVIDLVRSAGIDVADWANFKGKDPATNPKYCYEWSFIGNNSVVLNLWFAGLREDSERISHSHNWRRRAPRVARTASETVWKRRAKRFDEAIQLAYEAGLPVRTIICDGTMRNAFERNAKASRVTKRMLDPVHWAVTKYDAKSGQCTLVRGARPVTHRHSVLTRDDELEGFEGEARKRFVLHRRREIRLRRAKLLQVSQQNGGRVVCEVPNCGFDFARRYGPLGAGFAQVHHLTPLSKKPARGNRTSLKDLAVVCANCHAMIHRGGACRPLPSLITLSTGRRVE